MVGIYTITSPSEKVYIGQSREIKKRIARYRERTAVKYRKLYASLMEYGFDNHKVEVIHELPIDVSQEVMDEYEKLYMQCFTDCGIELLNLKAGGSAGAHCDETKKIISKVTAKTQFKRGQKSLWFGKEHSEDSKRKMSESAKKRKPNFLGKHHSSEVKEAQRQRMIGKTSPMKGVKGEQNPTWKGGRKAALERYKQKHLNNGK